jgi:nucleoside-diphosphate-sugar epimerase
MTHLITGGAGFIGSHLTDALIERGDDVVVLDDLSTGRVENLAWALESGRCEFVQGSTSDPGQVDELVADTDTCFHLASAVGVQLILDSALDSLRRNVRGCDNVMHAAARFGKRLVFSSTSEVYGKNSKGALQEESDRLLGPTQTARWSYAIAKSFGESLAMGLHREEGAEIVVVRLFNTTGPRQTGAYGMVLPTFVRQALAGEPLTVFGAGTQSRCFAHVADTVRGLLLLADHPEATGRFFNIGVGAEVTIIELAERVIQRLGSDSEIELVPFDEAYGEGFEELGRRQPDTTALRELTGWTAELTVEDAVDDLAYERGRELVAEAANNGHRRLSANSHPRVRTAERSAHHIV